MNTDDFSFYAIDMTLTLIRKFSENYQNDKLISIISEVQNKFRAEKKLELPEEFVSIMNSSIPEYSSFLYISDNIKSLIELIKTGEYKKIKNVFISRYIRTTACYEMIKLELQNKKNSDEYLKAVLLLSQVEFFDKCTPVVQNKDINNIEYIFALALVNSGEPPLKKFETLFWEYYSNTTEPVFKQIDFISLMGLKPVDIEFIAGKTKKLADSSILTLEKSKINWEGTVSPICKSFVEFVEKTKSELERSSCPISKSILEITEKMFSKQRTSPVGDSTSNQTSYSSPLSDDKSRATGVKSTHVTTQSVGEVATSPNVETQTPISGLPSLTAKKSDLTDILNRYKGLETKYKTSK